jgi:hypothetical protein
MFIATTNLCGLYLQRYGPKDQEERYRRRYLDLMNEEIKHLFVQRNFGRNDGLWKKGFSRGRNTGPNMSLVGQMLNLLLLTTILMRILFRISRAFQKDHLVLKNLSRNEG